VVVDLVMAQEVPMVTTTTATVDRSRGSAWWSPSGRGSRDGRSARACWSSGALAGDWVFVGRRGGGGGAGMI